MDAAFREKLKVGDPASIVAEPSNKHVGHRKTVLISHASFEQLI
jgi:hypothetical protein